MYLKGNREMRNQNDISVTTFILTRNGSTDRPTDNPYHDPQRISIYHPDEVIILLVFSTD